MWPFKKKKLEEPKEESFSEILDRTYDYDKYFTQELIEWFARENDPIKLGSAYALINCFGWPDFMPLPDASFSIKTHGWGFGGEAKDYSMIKFVHVIMRDLENKCERLSPGTLKQIWITGLYRKYNIIEKKAVNA